MFEFHHAANELAPHSPDSPVIELSLVTFDRAGASAEFVAAARELGLEVDVIPERGRFDRSVIRALRKIVAERSPDVIVTHQVKSHFLMKVSGLWKKYPWVAFNHGYTTTDKKMLLYNRLDRWSLPRADRVVTVCEAFAKQLVKMGIPRARIHVQHNSIRPEPAVSAPEMYAFRRKLGVKNDERMILAVGRLSKEKAQIDLLHAFRKLSDTHAEINARLVIVGDGPERENLEMTAASLGISDRVIFTGQVKNVEATTQPRMCSRIHHTAKARRTSCWKRWPQIFRSWRRQSAACRKWLRTIRPRCWFPRAIRKRWPTRSRAYSATSSWRKD